MKNMPIGMLTTQTADLEIRSRPMLVHGVDEQGWVWLLTDRTSRKAWDLTQNPNANISFQSPRGDRYVSVQGTALVVKDNLRLKRLWNPTYRAWFPKGKTDPELVLVAVKITRVEYWLVPKHRIARVAGAVRATITGKRHEAGRHGVLDLSTLPA